MWFKENKWKIIIPVLIIAVLVAAFFADKARVGKAETEKKIVEAFEKQEADSGARSSQTPETRELKPSPLPETGGVGSSSTVAPQHSETQVNVEKQTEISCTISVSCEALLNNSNLLSEEKRELVPESGFIFAPMTVAFSEGESVFDVLKRTLKENGIHMEFVDTPAYNSAYIEGIGNLYELDAGALSGWMFRVNGVFPNYGCSRYILKNGDAIEWLYTYNLGEDIGGKNDYAS